MIKRGIQPNFNGAVSVSLFYYYIANHLFMDLGNPASFNSGNGGSSGLAMAHTRI